MSLANVFKKCLEYYGLDPCQYFSSPGLSWHAMLKMTGVESEVISYVNIYLFVEKYVRKGISYIAKRYRESNNKWMNFSDDS